MVQQQKHPRSIDNLKSKALLQQPQCSLDDIQYNLLQTEFQTAVKATSLARYLCEHFDSLSISIQSRILNTHDFLMLFIPLIDEPPWTRRRSKTRYVPSTTIGTEASDRSNEILVWEKYVDQEWKEIHPGDLLNITQCEAQCWIAVFHLTCGNVDCREQYALNTYRKEQILRLRKFLNEYIMDQLPVLVDVTRYMDQLSLMNVPESANSVGMTVLMEQIDQLRESLFNESEKDWDQIAAYQFETTYSKTIDSIDEDLRLIATIYNEDNVDFCFGDYDKEKIIARPDSLHVAKVEICISDLDHESGKGDTFIDVFTLTPYDEDESIIVQTPSGPFRRMKLEIEPTGDFHRFCKNSNHHKLQANISFKGVVGIKQLIVDVDFPQDTNATKKVEWVQLGKLEDKLVIQLGFRRNDEDVHTIYNLDQAYMAEPADTNS
jgi:hypothetical protein